MWHGIYSGTLINPPWSHRHTRHMWHGIYSGTLINPPWSHRHTRHMWHGIYSGTLIKTPWSHRHTRHMWHGIYSGTLINRMYIMLSGYPLIAVRKRMSIPVTKKHGDCHWSHVVAAQNEKLKVLSLTYTPTLCDCSFRQLR